VWYLLAQASASASNATGNPSGYFIGWGTLSLINAGLAQSKNRSGLLWWVLSLIFGPLATLVIVAFLNKVEPEPFKPAPLREV
jgi:hypothetical protein